jgi:arylsulfatase A-like enzyme
MNQRVASLLLLVSFFAGAMPLTAAEKPNIIFIMADDLGYGDLGCYGQKIVQTPNLDQLARNGVRFTQAYSGSTVCAPARSVLMTGQHTGHTRVRGNLRIPLRPEDVTVAEVLKQAGYTTGLIGKWGLGEPGTTGIPNRKGFDYFFGYLNQRHAHNYYTSYLWRNEERVPLPNVVPNEDPQGGGVATVREVYSHDLFTREALEFVERHKARPFFLYLAYTIPHANNGAGQKGMEVPDLGPYTDRDWPEPQKGFAGMMHRLDRDIGALVQRLEELNIANNTIVFFTSDNGPHREGGNNPQYFNSSGPLRGIKRDLYEGGIRVPMIVQWPARIQKGRVSDQIVTFWDFFPTAAELAGTTAPPGIDGISLVPALLGKEQTKQHEFLYWEFHERGFTQAVRMGDWKAVRSGGHAEAPLELYDLSKDLGEKNNLAAAHPEILAKIEGYLKTARTDSEHWPVRYSPRPKTAQGN